MLHLLAMVEAASSGLALAQDTVRLHSQTKARHCCKDSSHLVFLLHTISFYALKMLFVGQG